MAVYRTAQGKSIDMGALLLRQGQTRAVGNMGVNAKGDIVDANNRTIDKRTDRVKKGYNRQVHSNVSHDEVQTQAAPPKTERKRAAQFKKTKADATTAPETAASVAAAPQPAAQAETAKPVKSGGLGAAIARARSIRQEPGGAEPNQRSGITKI